MGTTSEKLTYLNETKQELKQAINNLGGDITNETTFREYAQELDNIYDNIPKTTGEDTNLSLNTIKGKMEITPKGDTQQNTYSGKNKLPNNLETTQTKSGVTATKNEDGSITLNGTSTASTYFAWVTNTTPLTIDSGTYTASWGTTGQFEVYYQTSSGYPVSTGASSITSKTFTLSENTTFTNIRIAFNSGVTFNNFRILMQLETGSSVTNYEPYVGGTASPNPSYPQNIEVVTGTQEVKVENVNLLKDFRPSTQTLNGVTFTNNGNGTFKINGTSSAYTQFVDSDSFTLPKGTYTLSGRSTSVSGATMQLRSPDGYTIITQSNTKTAFTLSKDTQVRFRIVVTANITYSNAEFEPMILSGDRTQNLPSYEEHQEQTQTISLGDIELCKIGNYQDYLYKSNDKWYKKEYLHKEKGGDKNWGMNNYDSTYKQFFATAEYPIGYETQGVNSTKLIMSERFKGAVGNTDGNAVYGGVNTQLIVCIAPLYNGVRFTDTTTFKQFLANNNVHFYIPLATPQDIEITNETLIEQLNNLEKLKSYNGVTNISSSGNLPFIISASALKGE